MCIIPKIIHNRFVFSLDCRPHRFVLKKVADLLWGKGPYAVLFSTVKNARIQVIAKGAVRKPCALSQLFESVHVVPPGNVLVLAIATQCLYLTLL